MSSLATSRFVQTFQSVDTFRHARLTTSLPTMPLNKGAGDQRLNLPGPGA